MATRRVISSNGIAPEVINGSRGGRMPGGVALSYPVANRGAAVRMFFSGW
jgi:hypothetical protein